MSDYFYHNGVKSCEVLDFSPRKLPNEKDFEQRSVILSNLEYDRSVTLAEKAASTESRERISNSTTQSRARIVNRSDVNRLVNIANRQLKDIKAFFDDQFILTEDEQAKDCLVSFLTTRNRCNDMYFLNNLGLAGRRSNSGSPVTLVNNQERKKYAAVFTGRANSEDLSVIRVPTVVF